MRPSSRLVFWRIRYPGILAAFEEQSMNFGVLKGTRANLLLAALSFDSRLRKLRAGI